MSRPTNPYSTAAWQEESRYLFKNNCHGAVTFCIDCRRRVQWPDDAPPRHAPAPTHCAWCARSLIVGA